jgi:plastocyanin
MTAFVSFRTARAVCAASLVFAVVACGGDKPAATDSAAGAAPAAAASAGAPAPTGTVITIEMITDDTGNYFKPAEVTAKPGDVLKFVLTTGVHNVHFLADSNPGVSGLPAATAFAQLPGQALEIPVTMAAGKSYYFQCDPHAALGMKGHVTVQ